MKNSKSKDKNKMKELRSKIRARRGLKGINQVVKIALKKKKEKKVYSEKIVFEEENKE